jgi:hypothetical protein
VACRMLQEKFFPLLRRVLEEYVFSLPMELFQMLQFANRALLVESWHTRHVLWFVLFYVIFSCIFVEFLLVNWNVCFSVIRINQILIYGLGIPLCTDISRAMLVLEFLLCLHSWPPIPYCMSEQGFLLLPVRRRNSWVKTMHLFPLLYHLLS